MTHDALTRRASMGAAAGLAGTALIQGMMQAGQKWAPWSLPPIDQDPGEFMVQQAEKVLPNDWREKVPDSLEHAAARSLAFGYGTTFGALYAAARPTRPHLLLEGTALGLIAWGAGYLGWLPATGLMPPITKQEPEQIAGPIVSHILFGIATVGLYRLLRRI